MTWGLCLLPLPLPPSSSLLATALQLGWLIRIDVKVSYHSLQDYCWECGVLRKYPWFLNKSLMIPPFQTSILLLLSTTTLGQSIDCKLLCSPLKLAFGEEFRAFPVYAPPTPTFIEGCSFTFLLKSIFAPSPPNICYDTFLLWPDPSGKVGKESDFSHLVMKPHLFAVHETGKCILGPHPCHPLLSSSADTFFSTSGFHKMERTVTRVTQTCQLSKSLVVKLGERPQKTHRSTHDPSE